VSEARDGGKSGRRNGLETKVVENWEREDEKCSVGKRRIGIKWGQPGETAGVRAFLLKNNPCQVRTRREAKTSSRQTPRKKTIGQKFGPPTNKHRLLKDCRRIEWNQRMPLKRHWVCGKARHNEEGMGFRGRTLWGYPGIVPRDHWMGNNVLARVKPDVRNR